MIKKTIMKNKIIIGSRGSDLALWQSNYIKSKLQEIYNDVDIQIEIIKTKGDKIVDIALSKIGDKSLFTKELETALLEKKIDLAVHSLKDLQTVIPKGLRLSAVAKRHNVEDALISRERGTTISDLKTNAVVATGSLRRKSQLLRLRKDLTIEELRGNVPTRIDKFLNSNWDAIVLARAGVERLKMENHISSFIPIEEMIPAVGQGALAVEIHQENFELHEMLKAIHDEKTYTAVSAERAFMKKVEGGCQVPVGAFAFTENDQLKITGYIGAVDGSFSFKKDLTGTIEEAEKLGEQLAVDLLDMGGKEILDEINKKVRSK